jgi:bifunctional DNA-binding transcriptional regulator/antitoxin component of YhaV-PrlF toxin-antitoxin module
VDLIANLYLVLRCRVNLGGIFLGVKYNLYIHLLHINKADIVVHVEDTEENLTNIETLIKDSSCEKCLDLETKLQEALKDLSSAQLSIELLRDEYKPSMSVERDSVNPTTLQVRLDREESDDF